MKRTDKNGRVLMTGEQQLIDGSYEYRIIVKNRRYSICCDDLDELREEEKKFDLDKANLNKIQLTMHIFNGLKTKRELSQTPL